MANIYDVANELSRTLRDLPEYKAAVLRFHGFQSFGIGCLCGTEYSGKQQG